MKSIPALCIDVIKALFKLIWAFSRLVFRAAYLLIRNRTYMVLRYVIESKASLLATQIYYTAKLAIPYNKAKVCMAYRLYEDSELYRQRCIQSNQHFAEESFGMEDYNSFSKELTWRDKLKALVIPFSYCSSQEE